MSNDMGGLTDPYGVLQMGANKISHSPVDSSTSLSSTLCTAAGTAHVKGAYEVLFNATSAPCNLITIVLSPTNAGRFAVDIAIGPPGGEVVVLENLFSMRASAVLHPLTAVYTFPVRIPMGARVSARIQSSVASRTMFVSAICSEATHYASTYAGAAAIGFDTSTTEPFAGTALSGATNTKSSWASRISNRTTELLWVANHSFADTTISSGFVFLFDVARSPGTDYIVKDMWGVAPGNGTSVNHCYGPWPVYIPAYTTLWWRMQCDLSNANSAFRSSLYGCYR